MAAGTLDAIEAECERISACALDLSDDDFAKPTRCPAWNVKELLAHLYRDIEQVATFVGLPPAAAIDADAVSYWGMYDPVTDGGSIADRAKMRAAAYGTGQELARVWSWMWPKALRDARSQPPNRPVTTWGPGMLLEEFMRTRLVEVVIHGLDLSDALGRDPWVTADAAARVRDVLLGRLGSELPAELGWDDVTFIEKSTDRAELTDDERAILGSGIARLPLLG